MAPSGHSPEVLGGTQVEQLSKRAVRIPEAARLLSIGQRLTVTLVQKGELRSVRAGRCVLIPIEAIEAFLAAEGE